MENRTKAVTWLEMGKGVKLVVNRLGVHLPTIGRLTLKIQGMGEDKGMGEKRGEGLGR